jgi:hypothetical protein
MPASKFAAWLGARSYSKSGVTGVTSVTDTPKPNISAGLGVREAVTPSPAEGVTGVTNSAPSGVYGGEASKHAVSGGARSRGQPIDFHAFLNEMHEGVIVSTRPSRRGRRYRRALPKHVHGLNERQGPK